MKRLTKTYSDGSFGIADDLPCGENSYDFKNLLIKTLGEYEDAEEQGLLIKLPYKPGGSCYRFWVDTSKWTGFNMPITEVVEYYFLAMGLEDIYQWGKTIFATKEEACDAFRKDRNDAIRKS